jgi:Ran GTPase-activating protein (RanGAP) involved in mRNA processing and transport
LLLFHKRSRRLLLNGSRKELRGNKLTTSELDAVLQCVIANDLCYELDLSYNNIDNASTDLVANFLKHNKYVSHFNISYNAIGLSGRLFHSLYYS